jgi:Ser/Thr protein kinase RdoA (MazF antagonist)
MHWPADHPLRTDPRLAKFRSDADAVCPEGSVVAVLRYKPGSRVSTLVRTPDGPAVLKLHRSEKASGNHLRLQTLRLGAGSVQVPRPIAVGPAGHAGLLEHVPGLILREFSGADFVAACEEVGLLLARLHGSDVRLGRDWTAQSESDHLAHRYSSRGGRWVPPAPDTLVPTHRDLHHGQVIVAPGTVRLIDLDEAAMAPAGLDVGRFLAHLSNSAVHGKRPLAEAEAAAAAFLRGYGRTPRDLPWWRGIALARLACSAEERHGRPDWAASLRAVVG